MEKHNTLPWPTSQLSPILANMASWWLVMQPELVEKTRNGVAKNPNVVKSIVDRLDLCLTDGWKAPE